MEKTIFIVRIEMGLVKVDYQLIYIFRDSMDAQFSLKLQSTPASFQTFSSDFHKFSFSYKKFPVASIVTKMPSKQRKSLAQLPVDIEATDAVDDE